MSIKTIRVLVTPDSALLSAFRRHRRDLRSPIFFCILNLGQANFMSCRIVKRLCSTKNGRKKSNDKLSRITATTKNFPPTKFLTNLASDAMERRFARAGTPQRILDDSGLVEFFMKRDLILMQYDGKYKRFGD